MEREFSQVRSCCHTMSLEMEEEKEEKKEEEVKEREGGGGGEVL